MIKVPWTRIFLLVFILLTKHIRGATNSEGRQDFLPAPLLNCRVAINRVCPDQEVTFYLYTKQNPEQPERITVGAGPNVSNLRGTAFNPALPTKVIIHGYNSDMHLTALNEIVKQYMLSNRTMNVFTVDWGPLSQGPCYPAAVWNTRHVGTCTGQLVQRIRDTGNNDIHVIGFSLGAHVTNYMAVALKPYRVPRITGLDPALPGYVGVSLNDKLDRSDAEYVDILHTNAFMQGKVEESGHADFYINGGVLQPGCWAERRFFACNHHRAPLYFAETINTDIGFWGWPCPSYLRYLLGQCPPGRNQVLMGEYINRNVAQGVYLVITESVSPYAVGQYFGPTIEIVNKAENLRLDILNRYENQMTQLMNEDNAIEALEGVSERDETFGSKMEAFFQGTNVDFDFDDALVDDTLESGFAEHLREIDPLFI